MKRISSFVIAVSIVVLGLGLLGWVLYGIARRAEDPVAYRTVVRVMTYSSFFVPTGPGPLLKAEYEKRFGCDVEFVDGGDSALMVERLKSVSEKQIDLVLGISLLHHEKAQRELNWQNWAYPEKVSMVPELNFFGKVASLNQYKLVPYNWAPMTFVYREGEVNPPRSWEDLARPEYKRSISAQDPRFSTPGNYLSFWAWDKETGQFSNSRIDWLKNALLPLSPSWSVSYGLFRSKNAKLTFTYATSPFYHRLVEKDESYKAAVFNEPHPFEVELAGIPVHCVTCWEAKRFIQFLLEPASQRILMEKNFMLPVVTGVKESSVFAEMAEYPLISWDSYDGYDKSETNWAKKFVDTLKTRVKK
jgi:thiamine transport system substrate-binding protein